MLGISTHDQGSVSAGGTHFPEFSGLATEVEMPVPPTRRGTDRVREVDEKFLGMDIEAAPKTLN